MTCPGCEIYELPPIVTTYCDGCGRIVRQADVDRWHAEMVAPRKRLEDERFELALREGGG